MQAILVGIGALAEVQQDAAEEVRTELAAQQAQPAEAGIGDRRRRLDLDPGYPPLGSLRDEVNFIAIPCPEMGEPYLDRGDSGTSLL